MPRQRVYFVVLLCFAILLAVAPVFAQGGASLPIAALTDNNVWVYGLDGSALRLTNARPQDGFFELTWSPDGSRLAFVGVTPASGRTSLFVTDLRTSLLTELASGLDSYLPVSFTPDSTGLVYTTPISDGLVQAFRYEATAGQAPVAIGTFNVVTNCPVPPGHPLPNEFVYGRETSSEQFPRYVLAMTTFGLLHSTNCRAPDLWLMNPTNGEDVQLFETIDDVFVSPDLTRAVVVQGETLTFVNTERGPYTQIIPPAQPDQVGFGLAGSNEVFYSSREVVGPTPLPQGVAAMLGNVYFQMPMNYRVQIHRFSLRSGRDDVVYEADAYGIGRITLLADGDTLLFSQIPNADLWVQALADGALFPEDLNAAEAYVAAEVYALSLSTGSAQQLGRDWNRMAVNVAAAPIGASLEPLATVPPPTSTPIHVDPTPTLPPTLTPRPEGMVVPTVSDSGVGIGLTMRVTRNIGALNVRENPGTGSRVVELMFGGEEVTVLDGPQDDLEGFRWWKVRVPSGAEGWVAERVNGILTLELMP